MVSSARIVAGQIPFISMSYTGHAGGDAGAG